MTCSRHLGTRIGPRRDECHWPVLASMCPMAIILFTQCVFVTCSLLAISCAFYRLLLHPLAHVPGPRLAALSNVWHAYHVRNGHMLQLAKKLHHQYGPIVRIGPNEVWCNSRAAFLEVYSMYVPALICIEYSHIPGATSGFEKSNFYGEQRHI